MQEEQVEYRNFYVHCGETWEDDWSCMCNDECPKCLTKDIEPYHSIEIEFTDDLWAEKYRPCRNHVTGPGSRPKIGDGEMYETYGPELQYVLDIWNDSEGYKHIWTLIGTGNKIEIVPGFHHINRIGYFITTIAFDERLPPLPYLWSVFPAEGQGDENAKI